MKYTSEIKYRDVCGRILKLKIRNKEIETPLLLPVINPNKEIISIKELKEEFKIKAFITNAYILYKNKKYREITDIHKFFDFDGIIETDSGSYQMLHYRKELNINNREIVEFQIRINSDIINVLDIPTDIDKNYEEAKEELKITIDRIKEGIEILGNRDILINGAVQGGIYKELRKEASIEVSKLNVDIYAIGTIVPYLIKYRFKELFELIMESIIYLNKNKPVHLFGLGHTLIFPLSVGIGGDIFDSASYSLFAEDLRIITHFGTFKYDETKNIYLETPKKIYHLDEIKDLPKPDKIKIIAKHNLYTLLKEIEIIKDAIKNQYLWDLILYKAHIHRSVYEATKFVLEKYYNYIKILDPIRKKSGIVYKGDLLELRTDIKRALERLNERVNKEDIEYLYDYVFPFKELK